MSDTQLASMNITNVSNGLNVTTTGNAGGLQVSSTLQALSGFNLSTAATSAGLNYPVATLHNQSLQSTPPTVVVQAHYSQSEGFSEVDFTTLWSGIPEGTQLEIQSSVPAYTVSKRAISGTNNLGLIGKNLGPIKADFTVNLWLPTGAALSPQSILTLSLARIESSNGGPQKKTELGRTELKLA
jgi:hypothetical protein